MTIRNLDKLFSPKSVAVIGASNQPNTVGSVVMKNLLEAGFPGPVMPVNPKYEAVGGVFAYPDVASLPIAPDLAIVAVPTALVPKFVGELGERGTRAAIVLTAGLGQVKDETGRTIKQAMLDAARPHCLRLLGPNCLGLLVPGAGLNASFAHVAAAPGKIAFVSQSGALCTAVLDWAVSGKIGFSHFISLGDCADIDFGDCLDYLASDPDVNAILLYIESIKEARKFMSAARAAARNKPVLAIKAGRAPEGAKAAASHTGALAGADDVYDAAITRAGMLRVYEIDELFDAVETLARARPIHGDRLMMLTNGGGPGVMAADSVIEQGGRLAELAPETFAALDKCLPNTWSRANPVDIIGDARPDRYAKSIKILLGDPNADAHLVMLVPTAVADIPGCAQAVIDAAKDCPKIVLTSWLGRESVEGSRRMFAEAGIPTYETPGNAVRAFMHMVRFRRNQELLMETPASWPSGFTPHPEAARKIVAAALAEERDLLSEPEAKAVLAAYQIPVVETRVAATVQDAVQEAGHLGFPVAIKVLSPDITHKSDVGGVALDLDSPQAVRSAAEAMLARIKSQSPGARLSGFSVQKMARRPRAHELIVGAATDPIFGPVILFGQGGTAVEVIGDRAVGLPPLNMNLADEMIRRTRVAKLLKGYRDRQPADLDAIRLTLIKLSQLIVDLPEVLELDINPLYADERGVLALDARIRVANAVVGGTERLAIRPYPKELEEIVKLKSGREVLARPIRPEDEPNYQHFLESLGVDDIRFRFFGLVRSFPHSQMARFTQIDYDREMAFVARVESDGHSEIIGEVRAVADPDNQRAEFAIAVRTDLKGQGLGRILLEKLIAYWRARGAREIVGEVMSDNRAMLGLAHRCGFEPSNHSEGGITRIKLKLAAD